MTTTKDVTIDIGEDFVAVVEMHRPPNNFFDRALIVALVEAYETLDADPACRAIVLCSEGKHFCAGAQFTASEERVVTTGASAESVYTDAPRLFAARTPVVAAVQGAAVGGGLGLACSADFRVTCAEARFAANFARLGFHHGFGLTVTLPLAVGHQRSLDLLYTGRRLGGEDAVAIGLADRLAPLESVRDAARELAAEIAQSAPLAVESIRSTMRGHLADAIRAATDIEGAEQDRTRATADFREGVAAYAERRPARFTGE